MSSSRRRGRSPGAPANPQSPTVTATPAGVADALLAETPVGEGQEDGRQEDGPEDNGLTPETNEAEAPALEAAAEQPAADAVAEDAVKAEHSANDGTIEEDAAETGAPFVESAPAEAQAADNQPTEHPVQEAAETVADTTEAVASETADIIETQAETLAQAAPVPVALERSDDAKPKTHSVRIGASFALVPTLAPFTEINARLFAFARGEGEAAIAHIQALAQAKSPAEAIRLQVSEMQRAADASLTCFSEIVRSANRLNDGARWH